jgi:hypothetical protein
VLLGQLLVTMLADEPHLLPFWDYEIDTVAVALLKQFVEGRANVS